MNAAESAGSDDATSTWVARRYVITGLVQGVGMRPTIARVARDLRLTGYVENATSGVVVFVEGSASVLSRFETSLESSFPRRARITSFQAQPATPLGLADFGIRVTERVGGLSTHVPVDLRVCDACLSEVFSDSARRGGYAFVSCTDCGPRYSIVRQMPFERVDTSMAAFPPCVECAREYADLGDRRFHAQTNACRRCGPRLRAVRIPAPGIDRARVGETSDVFEAADLEAVRMAHECLDDGGIVALQGIGGFQLLADATQEATVQRLRQGKLRPVKPLAVMVAELRDAETWVELSDGERMALASPAGPIVIARARGDRRLAEGVHPGLSEMGIMLATTPLHALLTRGRPPLVATSGNVDGEPLAYKPCVEDWEGLADIVLLHDRRIEQPVDDSVVRVMDGRPVSIRLARGLAPLVLPNVAPADSMLRGAGGAPQVVALGGHKKAACALFNGAQSVLGPHIGDLDHESARQRYLEQLRGLTELHHCRAEWIAHDEHPEYFTTRFATQWNSHFGDDHSSPPRPIAVQHHHAHVVATMWEHDLLDRQVLGIAWDGTGWGPDGTIWGGEFLVATATEYERRARLRPFRLPGGESAIREPWRIALAMLIDLWGDRDAACEELVRFCPLPERSAARPPTSIDNRLAGVARLAASGIASPWTSSGGRLFDAAAVLILRLSPGAAVARYEGELAARLEACRETLSTSGRDFDDSDAYPFPLTETTHSASDSPWELDWRPLLAALLEDRRRDVDPRLMARRFHSAVASGMTHVIRHFSDLPVVLGGGVFQNRWLVEQLSERLRGHAPGLFVPGVIPPGDGGLAAGQLAVALARINLQNSAME